jgi:hypothetical protein
MPDVSCRQWGPATFAAYLDLGLRYPVFVGCEESREAAVEWGRTVLADVDGSLENRCGASGLAASRGDLERASMRESLAANKNRPGGRSDTSVAPGLTSSKGRLCR